MLIKTRGIVFRKIKYSETSVIADILTEQHGLLSYIISGVRSSKARTSASVFELMTIVDMVAYHSDRQTLHRIKEIRPAYLYQTVPFDVRKNAIILFIAELCSRTIKETEKNTALFNCIESALKKLDKAKDGFANFHLEFMITLADQLGFGPTANYTPDRSGFDLLGGCFVDETPHHQYFVSDGILIHHLIQKARGVVDELIIDRHQRNGLIDNLILYYHLHIENLPEIKSHKILREIM